MKTWLSNSILMIIFILWHLYCEDITLERQYSKILIFVSSEKYGFSRLLFLSFFPCFFSKCLKNVILLQSGKKKREKKIQKSLCFTWQSVFLTGWASESQGGLCANKQGLIFVSVPEKNDMFLWDLSVRVFAWARKHRHKYTYFFSDVLP